MLAYLWGLGLVLCLVAVQRLRIGKWLRRERIVTDPRVIEAFKLAQRQLGLARGCAVVEIEAIQAPMTIRTFYPVVALPKGFTVGLSDTELLTLALHELAHIKRNDPLLLSLASFVRAILFFHPLAWLAAREISTLGEEVADDAVLEATREPLPYAKMLTRLTEDLTRRMFATEVAIGIVFSKNALLRRIEAILSERSEQLRRMSIGGAAATILVALCAFALAIAFAMGYVPPTGTRTHAPGMVDRHVWNVPPSASGARGMSPSGTSPDGRYVSYVDWDAGNLAVRDLTTKTNWLVTKNTDTSWKDIDGWAEESVISPDGRQIAYSWYNEKGVDFYDLRIIGLDGSNLRVLYHDASVSWIMPYAWSPDSRDILASFKDADGSLVDEKTGQILRRRHLVLVSVDDGSVRFLRTWHGPRWPRTAVFSPDGRYIAYDFEEKGDPVRRDVFLLEIDGGREIPLVEHPADDQLLGWAPDGERILFSSDRTPRRTLWMIEVRNGEPQGSPLSLRREFRGWPIGFTRDGSFYYGRSTTSYDVLLAELDAAGQRFVGEPREVSSRFVGTTSMSDWSPDGSRLVYRSGEGDPWARGTWKFVVWSSQTGEERLLTPSPAFRPHTTMGGPRSSPDRRSLLVCGTAQSSGYGVYTVDVETGEARRIVNPRKRRRSEVVCSPDRNSIYISSWDSLTRLDMATGRETELYQGKQSSVSCDVSRDGRWLAFYADRHSLLVLPLAGGEPREVVHLDEEETSAPVFVRWTPDGQHLLFPRRESELWKVHVNSGEQQQMGPVIKNLVHAAIHPDGRQIALTTRQPGSELWVMENFLPD